ncbi:MAG: DMT family protein [Muribaculaceae bacterium]|nr:DMT family protein [Muribaculaceae bacterium]
MKGYLVTILLLIISNVFMTLAWYGHLKLQSSGVSKGWPLYLVILVSWGIALFEYSFQVPANRMGYQENGGPFTLFQLKIIQEVITLTVFTIVAMFMFSGEKLHWNHIAAFLCLIGAVCFTFLPKD